MFQDTVFLRFVARAATLGIRSITPLCVGYCCARLLLSWKPDSSSPRVVDALDLYTGVESAFYLLVYLPRRWYVNRAGDPYVPVKTRAERKALLVKTWDATPNPREYLSLWFYGVPIEQLRRDDVKDFLCLRMLHRTERSAEDDDELDEYLRHTEGVLGVKFEPGRSGSRIMAVTTEPLHMLHRPLFWYFCVGAMDFQMSLLMFRCGYQFHPVKRWFTALPLRPLSLFTSHRSPAGHLSYWYRPHRSQGMPIIFIHGIGIGLQTYMSFFHQLSRTATADDIGIIALEIMPISSRFTSPLPRKEVIVAEIQQILRHHGWSADNQKCVVMSQSYGSVIATYLLRECPDLVGPLLFVDPVAFSFHPPQVGWNFLRRKPTTASQLQLYYFASTDPDIARAMTRSFVWQENSLWREDVEDDREGRQCTVVLSEKDIIIDTLTLGRYLTRRPQKGDQPKWYQERKEHDDGWKTREWTGRGLEVVWYPGLNHAEVYDSYDSRKNLIDILQRYSTS